MRATAREVNMVSVRFYGDDYDGEDSYRPRGGR